MGGEDGGTKSGELPSRSLSAHWRITNERAFKEIFCTFLLRRRGGGAKVRGALGRGDERWDDSGEGRGEGGGEEGVVIVSGAEERG